VILSQKHKLLNEKSPDFMWDSVQFDLVNPTKNNAYFDLFNGWSLFPTPNTPYGYNPNIDSYLPSPIPISAYPTSVGTNINSNLSHNFGIAYIASNQNIYTVGLDPSISKMRVCIIDTATNNVTGYIILSIIASTSPTQIIYNPINNYVYVLNTLNQISVIDCNLKTEIATFTNTFVPILSQMTLDTSKNSLYITTNSNVIYEYSCYSNTIVNTITVPDQCLATQFYSIGSLNRVIVFSIVSGNAYVIDTSTNIITSTIVLPEPASNFGASCYNNDNLTVYYQSSSTLIRIIDVVGLLVLPTTIAIGGNTASLLYITQLQKIYTTLYNGSPKKIDVIDTNSNTIITSITVSTFGSYGLLAYDLFTDSIYGTNNSDVGQVVYVSYPIMPYITGSTEYNEFIQSTKNDVKGVRQIIVISKKGDEYLLNNPLDIKTRDANGNKVLIPKLPNINVSAEQFQGNMAFVNFECQDFILDNQTIIRSYPVPAGKTVRMIIFYYEINLGQILKGKYQRVVNEIEAITYQMGDVNERTEKQVMSADPHDIIPVRTTTHRGNTQNTKPFTFEDYYTSLGLETKFEPSPTKGYKKI
jgi:hypothetical protein